jgi:hypothetical protein
MLHSRSECSETRQSRERVLENELDDENPFRFVFPRLRLMLLLAARRPDFRFPEVFLKKRERRKTESSFLRTSGGKFELQKPIKVGARPLLLH